TKHTNTDGRRNRFVGRRNNTAWKCLGAADTGSNSSTSSGSEACHGSRSRRWRSKGSGYQDGASDQAKNRGYAGAQDPERQSQLRAGNECGEGARGKPAAAVG